MSNKTKVVIQKIILLVAIVLITVFIINTKFTAKPISKQTQLEMEIFSETHRVN